MTISYSHSPAYDPGWSFGVFGNERSCSLETPIGITSTTNWIGAVIKFTFELGDEQSK